MGKRRQIHALEHRRPLTSSCSESRDRAIRDLRCGRALDCAHPLVGESLHPRGRITAKSESAGKSTPRGIHQCASRLDASVQHTFAEIAAGPCNGKPVGRTAWCTDRPTPGGAGLPTFHDRGLSCTSGAMTILRVSLSCPVRGRRRHLRQCGAPGGRVAASLETTAPRTLSAEFRDGHDLRASRSSSGLPL